MKPKKAALATRVEATVAELSSFKLTDIEAHLLNLIISRREI
jgi:hypothetical protein